MKSILLDMNMSVDWVEYLNRQGFTAIRWSSVGNPNDEDKVIMEWARNNQHVLVTQDLDYGTLLALTQANGPSVIQIRGRLVMPKSTGKYLAQTLLSFEREIDQGALIVLDEQRARVRVLPLQ